MSGVEAHDAMNKATARSFPAINTPGWHEKLNHMLLNNIPFSLLIIDPGLRVILTNRNFLEKARRTEQNTIGMRVRDVFPEVILEFTQLEKKIQRVFESGMNLPGAQMTYRAPGLPIRIFYYTVIPIKSGNIVENALVIMDDITEKVQLSEKVRIAERHLASVIESANDLVISTDAEGYITSWNPAAEKISGFWSGEVRGKLLQDLCESIQRKTMAAIICQLIRGESVEFKELNLISSSGNLIPVDWSFSPIRDDQNQVSGVVAVGRDLTERRAFELHIFQSEKLAALGVMAGGIAHELRNPMSVIFSAAQFLQEPGIEQIFQTECVQMILSGIERSSLIIENMLRFARPSSNNQIESLNIVSLIQKTLSVLAPQAKLQKINMVEDFEHSFVPVSGNENLLQQVVMNLILNAFQATPPAGEVNVSLVCVEGKAVMRVRDTGRGVSASDLVKIFDPFFTTQPVGKGTGLGLSICHTIVKQHGGEIGVESSVIGHGSTFVVHLPLATIG